jgi:hypothetical protein
MDRSQHCGKRLTTHIEMLMEDRSGAMSVKPSRLASENVFFFSSNCSIIDSSYNARDSFEREQWVKKLVMTLCAASLMKGPSARKSDACISKEVPESMEHSQSACFSCSSGWGDSFVT